MLTQTLIISSLATLIAAEKGEGEEGNAIHHSKSHMNSLSMQPRIIGGAETPVDRYPYSVSLQSTQHFCGATIIAPDVLFTAAHCAIIDYSDVTAVIGSHDLEGKTPSGDGTVDKVPPGRVYVHPEYDASTNENDFALVFLPRPTTAGVEYVRLNSDPEFPSQADVLTALGWGDTTVEDGYDLSDVLLGVDLDYIPNDVCDASSDGIDTYQGLVKDSMICASKSGRDGCQGDSGGPIIVKGSDHTKDVQVGVSSWGYGCASPDFPGVYSRVSNGYRWIRNRVCRRSVDPPEWFDCWKKKSLALRFAINGKNGGGKRKSGPP